MPTDPRPLILHVLNALDGGGTERALVALLTSVDRSRFRHAVATLRGAGPQAEQLPDDVACRVIGAKGRRWTSGILLGSIVRKGNAAVIHARNMGTWTDAVVARILAPHSTVVLGYHGLDHAGPLGVKQRRLARWAARFGVTFTSVSDSGRRRLIQEAGVSAEQVTVLPNGVDLTRFRPATPEARLAARESLGLPQNVFVAGTVGSLSAVKRPDVLIEAFREVKRAIPTAQLVIVGEGPLRPEAQHRVAQAGLGESVRFTGRQNDVGGMLAAFDVFVTTSDSEEMSNAVLEAMACGIPVVATDVGDTATMVRHRREGLIVPVGSPSAAAQAVKELAGAVEFRKTLGDNARQRAYNFDFQETVRAYDAFYSTHASQTASRVMSSLCGAGPTKLATCLRT